ncbi:MAG: hypothetical protein M1503_00295 [Thaumarchaeota archaeon]|nr:hypothetical protein [Nitrososphaerota archaeon]MCL5316691.1 hypothetical protein [Nitrososphaerota archaeon]
MNESRMLLHRGISTVQQVQHLPVKLLEKTQAAMDRNMKPSRKRDSHGNTAKHATMATTPITYSEPMSAASDNLQTAIKVSKTLLTPAIRAR